MKHGVHFTTQITVLKSLQHPVVMTLTMFCNINYFYILQWYSPLTRHTLFLTPIKYQIEISLYFRCYFLYNNAIYPLKRVHANEWTLFSTLSSIKKRDLHSKIGVNYLYFNAIGLLKNKLFLTKFQKDFMRPSSFPIISLLLGIISYSNNHINIFNHLIS